MSAPLLAWNECLACWVQVAVQTSPLNASSLPRFVRLAADACPQPKREGPALCYPATECAVCCPTAPAGGVARCAAALAFVAAVAWLVVRRSRGQSAYAGLPAGALHASHAAHGLPSVIPGVRERFDLTEVVEQTGGFLRLAIGHASAFVRWRALRTLS